MKQIQLIIIILFALFNDYCKVYNNIRLELSSSMKQEIRNEFDNENVLIYYHSGECSFCYGVLISLLSEFPDLPLVSITTTGNRVIVDYYMEDIEFNGISISDSMNIFYEENQNLLKENNLFLIDSNFNILDQCKNLTDEFKQNIKDISNSQKKSNSY